jgi:hypothetical protein
VGEIGEVRADTLHHAHTIEVTEAFADEEQAGARVGEHLLHFRVSVDDNDGEDDVAAHRAGEVDDGGLDPVRRLEGDDLARAQPKRRDLGGQRLGVRDEVAEGSRLHADEDGRVRRVRGGDAGEFRDGLVPVEPRPAETRMVAGGGLGEGCGLHGSHLARRATHAQSALVTGPLATIRVVAPAARAP